MKKALLMVGVLAYMTVLGMELAHAQQVSLDVAIQRAAMELSSGIERGARIAVMSMEADSAGMSNYLIGEMLVAFTRMGFTMVDRSHIDLAAQEMDAQFILSGTFVSLGDFHQFRAQVIEVATGTIRSIHTANVQHDSVIAAFLGGVDMGAPRATENLIEDEQDRINWISLEIVGLGAGISYMRDINNWFSIGVTAWFDANLILFYDFGVSIGGTATTRFFPGGSPFFLELGLGGGWAYRRTTSRGSNSAFGIMIVPALGVRLGGQTRGFFVSPAIGYSFVFGSCFGASPKVGAGLGWAW